MHLHDSNPRLSVRGKQTDPRPFLSRIDWPVLFRVVARFMLAVCVLVAAAGTYDHLHRYGLGALQSVAQCLIVLCFFVIAMTADSHNVIVLMAALGILATLAL